MPRAHTLRPMIARLFHRTLAPPGIQNLYGWPARDAPGLPTSPPADVPRCTLGPRMLPFWMYVSPSNNDRPVLVWDGFHFPVHPLALRVDSLK